MVVRPYIATRVIKFCYCGHQIIVSCSVFMSLSDIASFQKYERRDYLMLDDDQCRIKVGLDVLYERNDGVVDYPLLKCSLYVVALLSLKSR